MRLYILLVLFVSNLVWASSDQLGIRINQGGMNSILEQAKKYNAEGKLTKIVTIPKKLYKFVIEKEKLAKNPIVNILNQITDIALDRDLKFNLETELISITGDVASDKLNFSIANQTSEGFDITLNLTVPKVVITSKKITLCDDTYKGKCSGLKASFISPKVSLVAGTPIKIAANFRVNMKGNSVKIVTKSITTNLNSTNTPPKLNVSFSELIVPEVKISINGQEATLDTSLLKDEVLKKKDFLAKKLVGFAADFLSEDLVEMLNKYLANEELPKDIDIFNYGEIKKFEFRDELFATNIAPADNTYVAVKKYLPPTLKAPIYGSVQSTKTPRDIIIERIVREIKAIVYYAKVTLKLGTLTAPDQKNLELKAKATVKLNSHVMKVGSTLRNDPNVYLPTLNMNRPEFSGDHFQLYISEPLINGMLGIINKVGLYNSIMQQELGEDASGFSINSVHVHFKKVGGNQKLFLVANAQIDLRKTATDGLGSWIKKQIGVWLEQYNNNAVIYFPLQIEVNPTVYKDANGKPMLKLKVGSPFGKPSLPIQLTKPVESKKDDLYPQIYTHPADNTYVAPRVIGTSFQPILNDFKYPSNVENMSNTVRDVVVDRLKEAFKSITDKSFDVDIEKMLSQKGVSFDLKNIKFIDSAYLMISADIKDINFETLNALGAK
jgi:hypothetical protein